MCFVKQSNKDILMPLWRIEKGIVFSADSINTMVVLIGFLDD